MRPDALPDRRAVPPGHRRAPRRGPRGVTLGGSETFPILGIIGRAPAGRAWLQFVVDSAGRPTCGLLRMQVNFRAQ